MVVLGRTYEWYKVQPLSTTKAYIRSDYLKMIKGGAVAVVLGDNVNVRSSASSDAASLGEVKKGTVVKVLEQVNGWSRLGPCGRDSGLDPSGFFERNISGCAGIFVDPDDRISLFGYS